MISKNQFLVGNFYFSRHRSLSLGGVVAAVAAIIIIVVVRFHLLLPLAMSMPGLRLLPPPLFSNYVAHAHTYTHSHIQRLAHTNSWDGIIALPEKSISRNTVPLPLSWLFYSIFHEIADELKRQLSLLPWQIAAAVVASVLFTRFTVIRQPKVEREIHEN